MDPKLNLIFKAYDIRGIYPIEIDEKIIYRIGQAYAMVEKPKKVAVGRDVRSSGKKLKQELVSSLLDSGVDVVDIGIITTDQLYFAVGHYDFDGGLSVTASHNPVEYNGVKFSLKGGAPITSQGLIKIRDWAASKNKNAQEQNGDLTSQNILDDYVEHVMSYINPALVKPLNVLANANFGAVGRSMDEIAQKLNLKLERINWNEDGSFPKGPPNPILPENRDETVEKIRESQPDFGVAWDADADRCFFFAGDGTFIPSCYIIALLSKEFLGKSPNSKIIHDITTSWVIDDTIKKAGGISISSRTGHTFIKARMREEDAVFAGESSGHYYFRDSFYADNGLVPFLMILELVSRSETSLAELVEPLMSEYLVSGEINFQVANPTEAINSIEKELGKSGEVDKTDGLVVESDKWRFSVRPSNTEPLFRFNAEAKSQIELDGIVSRITKIIRS